MSIELVIAALMALVAILIGFAGPAPHGEAVKTLNDNASRAERHAVTPEA